MIRNRVSTILILVAAILVASAPRAEVIEEIVAKVNDDIITKSAYEKEEQALLAQLYRQYTGEELDRRIRQAKANLLQQMIDRKILLHRAERVFQMDAMGDNLVKYFREQQKISSDQELDKLLEQEGMTRDDLKNKLIEMYAPDEVIRMEVTDRVSVPDSEVEAYYQAHPDEFTEPAKVTLREIILIAEDDASKQARRAEAEAIRERAAAPDADFAALAKEVSESGSKDKGGLLGTFRHGELAPQLEKAAFSIPVGSVSPVIEGVHGFHILKVDERTEERHETLEEVKADLRAKLENQKFNTALQEFLKKARAEATIEINPKYQSSEGPQASK